MGRKHNAPIESLPVLAQKFADDLAALAAGRGEVSRLEADVKSAGEAYRAAAVALSAGRKRSARMRLKSAVNAELAPLKLDRAEFSVDLRRDEFGRIAERLRSRGVLRPHQSRVAAGSIDEGGVGGRIGEIPARDQGAPGRTRHRADACVRRNRHRRRRRGRRRDGSAPGPALGAGPSVGGDPRAASGRARPEPLSESSRATSAAASVWPRESRVSRRSSGARRSPGCSQAPKSPAKPAPPPRA